MAGKTSARAAHQNTAPSIETLEERARNAEYRLDEAIRVNGYQSPLNQPFRRAVDAAQGRLDRAREQALMVEHSYWGE